MSKIWFLILTTWYFILDSKSDTNYLILLKLWNCIRLRSSEKKKLEIQIKKEQILDLPQLWGRMQWDFLPKKTVQDWKELAEKQNQENLKSNPQNLVIGNHRNCTSSKSSASFELPQTCAGKQECSTGIQSFYENATSHSRDHFVQIDPKTQFKLDWEEKLRCQCKRAKYCQWKWPGYVLGYCLHKMTVSERDFQLRPRRQCVKEKVPIFCSLAILAHTRRNQRPATKPFALLCLNFNGKILSKTANTSDLILTFRPIHLPFSQYMTLLLEFILLVLQPIEGLSPNLNI